MKCRKTSRNIQLTGEWEGFSKSVSLFYTPSDGKLFAAALHHWDKENRSAESLVDAYNQTLKRLENELGVKFNVKNSDTSEDGSMRHFVARWSNGKMAVSVGISGSKEENRGAQISIVFTDEALKQQAENESNYSYKSTARRQVRTRTMASGDTTTVRSSAEQTSETLRGRRMLREKQRCGAEAKTDAGQKTRKGPEETNGDERVSEKDRLEKEREAQRVQLQMLQEELRKAREMKGRK